MTWSILPTRRAALGAPIVAVALALAPACSKSDPAPAATGGPGSSAAPGSAAPSATKPVGTAAPGTTVPLCRNALSLRNAAAADAGLEDRPLEIKTAWADAGPHPANTVDDDDHLDVALAEFEIPKDKQFGYSIPVGDPGAPTGKLYLTFRLQLEGTGKVSAGQSFTDEARGSDSETSGSTPGSAAKKPAGTVVSYIVYAGKERLLQGDSTITITSIDDKRVCGKIESVTKTSIQSFIGIDGTFVLDRLQILNADS